MLTVSTFGKFQITDGDSVMNDENLRSPMLSKLFMYMLIYREKTLTTDDIATAIWQDEEVDNPAGALKNLMYRLRKTLASKFGDAEYIITNRGSYRWNPQIQIVMDTEQFEKLVNEAKNDNNYETSMEKYERAVLLYQGNFMNKISEMHWIQTLSTYYSSIYLSVVKALADLYIKNEKYEELEKLCNTALQYENADEQLYCYQIEARMRSGNIALALESYDKARNIMEKELGIRKTTILNKVYEELLAMSKGQTSYNIKEVKEDIEEENPQGVFFCGYPVFKEIYHLEVRKSSRSNIPENLILLTVEGRKEDPKEVAEFRVKSAMNGLENIIKESLRVGDVAAKYSDSQFIILLPSCNKELAATVANRIIANFYNCNSKYKKVSVHMNIEAVSEAGEFVQ